MLKSVRKPKATQSAFATQEVTFNEEKMPNVYNSSDITEIRAAIDEKLNTILKENKKQNDNRGYNNFI